MAEKEPAMRHPEAVLVLEAPNHRAMRRCHGCGNYSRPAGEVQGRLLCERCFERERKEPNADAIDLNEGLET
jgi:hypothetical protein